MNLYLYINILDDLDLGFRVSYDTPSKRAIYIKVITLDQALMRAVERQCIPLSLLTYNDRVGSAYQTPSSQQGDY